MLKSLALAGALLCALMINADARPRLAHPDCNVSMPCEGVGPSARGEKIARQLGFGGPQQVYTPRAVRASRQLGTVVGGRPAGCPARFCGCGASLHLFGKIIPSLNLAANWLRFPRAAPAPKMVAARRGHVFVLEQHISGSVWLVHDSNSGGRQTRIHARSIAGYQIVNPHAARYASAQ